MASKTEKIFNKYRTDLVFLTNHCMKLAKKPPPKRHKTLAVHDLYIEVVS